MKCHSSTHIWRRYLYEQTLVIVWSFTTWTRFCVRDPESTPNTTAHAHEQLLGKRDSNSIQSCSRENGTHLISHLAMYLVSARLLAPVTWKRLITQNFDIEIIMIILRFTECNRILSAVKLTTSVFYVAMPRGMTTAFRCNMLFLSSGLTSTSNPPLFDHSNNVLLWKLRGSSLK